MLILPCRISYLDRSRGESVLPLDDELVAVAADELDVHGVRPLAAPAHLLPRVHAAVHDLTMSVCNRQCGPSNKEEQALLVTKESTNFSLYKIYRNIPDLSTNNPRFYIYSSFSFFLCYFCVVGW